MGLSDACANSAWESFPPEVQERAIDLTADTLAVAALGSRRTEMARLVDGFGVGAPAGRSTVVGSNRTWPMESAVFLNASAIATDQLQDGHRMAKGHPASHIVPVAIALAEQHDLAGTDLLAAVVAGYEVGTRVGRSMGGTPQGVHDIGTWGVVAIAAAVARLLRPGDVEASERAINLAGSAVLLTDAQTIFQGRTGGHAFLGASSQLGLSLGTAAVAGLTALPGALERHLSQVASLDWTVEAVQEVQDRWDHFEVLRGYVKVHPTCAHLHGVNDAVADILSGLDSDRKLLPENIVDIEVQTFRGAAAFDTVARDELAARFSIPTSVAVAIVTGTLDENTMTDDVITSDRVMRLAERVRVRYEPALDAGYPAGRPAAVAISLQNGRVLRARCGRPRGDDDRALARAQMRSKARRLLQLRFQDSVTDILERIDGLGSGGSVRELGRAMRVAAGAVDVNGLRESGRSVQEH